MKEEEIKLIEGIREKCYSGDYERNGCELEQLIIDYFKAIGLVEIATEIEKAGDFTWRA